MGLYPPGAVERAMKVQEVILRAISGEINCIQAAVDHRGESSNHAALATAISRVRLRRAV